MRRHGENAGARSASAGNPIRRAHYCVYLEGPPLCLYLQGPPLYLYLQGPPLCLYRQGPPLYLYLQGPLLCLYLEGPPPCLKTPAGLPCPRAETERGAVAGQRDLAARRMPQAEFCLGAP